MRGGVWLWGGRDGRVSHAEDHGPLGMGAGIGDVRRLMYRRADPAAASQGAPGPGL